jgi:ABC-2 type transport system permease protein
MGRHHRNHFCVTLRPRRADHHGLTIYRGALGLEALCGLGAGHVPRRLQSLIGAAALSGLAVAQARGSAFANVLGRGIAHLTLYLTPLALYLVVLPRVYGFSALGNPLQLFALASVFVLATSFMGQAVGAWFKRPETATLIFLGTSLPQLFLTGFSWPREGIPKPVQAAGTIFPSNFAIDGLLRIDQLGANLWEVARDWQGLWILAFAYFALAVMSVALVKRRRAHG